jgi:adenosylhomocysteine nucleosidase
MKDRGPLAADRLEPGAEPDLRSHAAGEIAPDGGHPPVVVLISADAEWRAVRQLFVGTEAAASPLGEHFRIAMTVGGTPRPVIFFHGGWGKIAAAASTQYAIDRWKPGLLVNLGTCGGFEGEIERGTIVLAERTVVYDILEQMGDPEAHIAHYTTELDLSWLGEAYPQAVRRSVLVSGDRDLVGSEIPV